MSASATAPNRRALLLVEDEVLLRLALADYLRDCGYKVIEAASYDEAVEVLDDGDAIIDIVMSGLGDAAQGFGLAHWLRENRPAVPVLLNGSVTGAAVTAGELCEEGPRLAKPYDPRLLENRIRRLMRFG
jgi:DNA-binding response OmpR family regulator